MNKARRKALEKISDKLMELQVDLQYVHEEEEEAFDNMPESLQESERGDEIQEALSTMENADGAIQEAIDYLSDLL